MNPYERLMTYAERREHLLIGLMSGTSLDGVDAALVAIATNEAGEIADVSLKHFCYLPYSDELRERILSLCAVEIATLDQLVLANAGLSEWYAAAVARVLAEAGVRAEQVDAVCSHGQTVWHAPHEAAFPGPDGELRVRSTLQIGELSVLAERCGIPVVGNFRPRDLAAGGEGAPLVPYVDYMLFKSPHKGRILQNIGGIGNATVVPKGRAIDDVYAFDTGPGNMIMDALVKRETNGAERFDEGGKRAAAGRVSEELLQLYLQDPYYRRKPPKSTGREVYGLSFTEQFRADGEQRQLSFADILATATMLTARTIVQAYEHFIFPTAAIDEVIASGGGAHNETLLAMIRQQLPDGVKLTTAEAFGIPDDAKEALAFTVLGHETLMGRPSNVPAVTGASKPVVLGNVCW